MTLADMRRLSIRSIDAYCEAYGCGHSATISADALPASTFVPDVALRLRRTVCGSKKIHTRPSWKDAHAQGRRQVE